MTKIFISHSSKDTEFSLQLAQALNTIGVDVWTMEVDIPAGMKWSTAIQQGLDECEAMIVVITPEAMASNNVEDEWQYYFDKKKKVFPVRLKPANVHFQLNRIQYVDFHEKEFEEAFKRLSAELKRNGVSIKSSEGELHLIRSDKETEAPINEKNIDSKELARRLAERLLNKKSERNMNEVKNILPPPFEWVEIPGGEIILKDANSKNGTKGGRFKIYPFKIAKYPITKGQYEAFANKSDGDADPRWWDFSEGGKRAGSGRQRPDYMGDADYPRTEVTWFDAVAFCRWLSEKNGLQITLPTEQQWQHAMVGNSDWKYPWGNRFDKTGAIQSKVKLIKVHRSQIIH